MYGNQYDAYGQPQQQQQQQHQQQPPPPQLFEDTSGQHYGYGNQGMRYELVFRFDEIICRVKNGIWLNEEHMKFLCCVGNKYCIEFLSKWIMPKPVYS